MIQHNFLSKANDRNLLLKKKVAISSLLFHLLKGNCKKQISTQILLAIKKRQSLRLLQINTTDIFSVFDVLETVVHLFLF